MIDRSPKTKTMRPAIEATRFSVIVIVTVSVIGMSLMSTMNAVADETVTTEAPGPSPDGRTSGATGESAVVVPDLADIVPLATALSGRLVALENGIKRGPDIPEFREKHALIASNLDRLAGQLQRLKDSRDYRYGKLVELREAISQESESLEEISGRLSQALRQMGAHRREWLAEKKHWNQWRSSMLEDGQLGQLKPVFERVNGKIESALSLIVPQLTAMLAAQGEIGNVQLRADVLAAECDDLMLNRRHGVLLNTSPPMLSSGYFSQFSGKLWFAVRDGLAEIVWPSNQFFAHQGWIVILQGVLTLALIAGLLRKRDMLIGSERWRFLAARPFSAGLFLGAMATVLIYEYAGAPAIWKLAVTIVAGISFARLSCGLVDKSWKKRFVYGLITVLILTRLMDVANLPLPLFRLYTALAALAGVLFCLRWAVESQRHEEPVYSWLLRLASLYFSFIIIAEVAGKETLAEHLFSSFIRSVAFLLVAILFLRIMRGAVAWLFTASPLQRATASYSDTSTIIRQVGLFAEVIVCGLLVLPALLMIWGAFDSLKGATRGLLTFGLNLGSYRLSVGLVLVSAGIIYGSFLASWIVQRLVVDGVLIRRQVAAGVRHSIGKLVHYTLVVMGFLLAISTLGFGITRLTIILSALGVGIGFGLQGIVNNFVSGLILLFERPVRVGDTIELGGKWAEIRRIGIRSTTVKTLDEADVIIPNSDLITNQVTNWTLANRLVRLTISVGVAYGSDVPLVMETLTNCATAHEMIADFRPPQVLFLRFGESSLDFELRVWVKDADHRLAVTSALHQEIDRRFRESNIEIAFPQLDLHLRGPDESVVLPCSRDAEPDGSRAS